MSKLTPEQIAALRMVADHKTIIHNHDTTIVEVGARNALHAELVGLDLPDLAASVLEAVELRKLNDELLLALDVQEHDCPYGDCSRCEIRKAVLTNPTNAARLAELRKGEQNAD